MHCRKRLEFSSVIAISLLAILIVSSNFIGANLQVERYENKPNYENELVAATHGGLIVLIVNSTIFNGINTTLTQFAMDLLAAGYLVAIWNYSSPPMPRPQQAANLRIALNSYGPNLEGAIFFGKLPYMEYELGGVFPCDLYFMDLDGQWIDTNLNNIFDNHTAGSGDRNPEIWVGRIDPSTMNGTNEIVAINSYLARNHLYRIASLHRPDSALHFIDDSWSTWTSEWIGELAHAYTNQTVIATDSLTNSTRYELELTKMYEWVQLYVHSYYDYHLFYPTPASGTTNWTEIRSINTQQLFYSLYACSACDISMKNNIGTEYLFSDNTLAVIGSSKVGGLLEPGKFYAPLGAGSSLGISLKRWFSECTLPSAGLNNPANAYGMLILGDPSLETKYGPITTAPNLYSLINLNTNVYLQWTDSPDSALYYIYRNTAPISDITFLTPIGSTNMTNFVDTIPGSNTYYYVIGPSNSYANGSQSNCLNITVTIPSNIPGFEYPLVLLSIIILGLLALFQELRKRIKIPKLTLLFLHKRLN